LPLNRGDKETPMWKQLLVLAPALCASNQALADPWYAEIGYGGGSRANIAVGYDFNPHLGVEVGIRRGGEGQEIGLFGIGQLDPVDGYEISLRSAIELSARSTLTGRFGAYKWQGQSLSFDDSEKELTITEESRTSIIVGAGVRVRLGEHVHFTGEYAVSEAFFGNSDGMAAIGIRVDF
jgi:hypothetical protein